MNHATSRTSRGARILAVLALALAAATPAAGQSIHLSPVPELPNRIRVSERTNLSTREDGRYLGLLSRQGTGYLTREEGATYHGRFFVYQQVRRDLAQVARPIDRSFETRVGMDLEALFATDAAYPTLHYLLRAPDRRLTAGAQWEAPAWIVLAPRSGEPPLRLPVIVSYRAVAEEPWNGAPALRVEARFATRYPLPPTDDPDAPVVDYAGPIARVQGSHTLTMMIPASNGAGPSESPRVPAEFEIPTPVMLIRDEIREQYHFTDGTTRSVEGHSLLFVTGLAAERPRQVAEEVRRRLSDERVQDVTVEETSTGVRLTVQALRFLPDQAVLLPGESQRLDTVATALLSVEGSRFLIVGHTADVGTRESQVRLSVERARVIAGELAARGVSADLMDIEGRGGTEPVAPNDTEPGRARNRRVEIYIVEQ